MRVEVIMEVGEGMKSSMCLAVGMEEEVGRGERMMRVRMVVVGVAEGPMGCRVVLERGGGDLVCLVGRGVSDER